MKKRIPPADFSSKSLFTPRVLRQSAIFLLACFFLLALPAMAQENGASPVESTTGWIFRWINFAIVFFFIWYFFAKVAGPAFGKNREEISRRIAEGTRAREAAEQRRREVQAKMAGIQQEIAAMSAEAQQGAEAETKRIRDLAKKEAEAIDRAAQAEIQAARRAGQIELKMRAARLAVERAGALLQQELTPANEAALLRSFVGQIEGSRN
jgi:F0F1-type ATP synthase membrane subunit b/b'